MTTFCPGQNVAATFCTVLVLQQPRERDARDYMVKVTGLKYLIALLSMIPMITDSSSTMGLFYFILQTVAVQCQPQPIIEQI